MSEYCVFVSDYSCVILLFEMLEQYFCTDFTENTSVKIR